MDQVVNVLQLPRPDYIKMDVDGLEHFILKGGAEVLNSVQGILVEINDDFTEQAHVAQSLLESAGLVFHEKRHSEMYDNSTAGFQHSFNQIWFRGNM